MSGSETLGADETRAREAVRGLDRPVPGAAFRARLRAEFVAGSIRPTRPRVVPWHSRPATLWGSAALAAAAAFLVVTALNRPPSWSVASVTGEGLVVVDGVPVPTAHAADLARRLRPGALVHTPAGVEIEIESRGVMAVQFSPATQASVPNVPGRWFDRAAAAEIRSGELRVATGAGFRGARFDLRTPEARIEVAGTTFAVICEPAGTCLCVMEGVVKMGARAGGPMHEVTPGRRRFMFADGREDEAAAMRETEHGPLGEMRARMGGEHAGGR